MAIRKGVVCFVGGSLRKVDLDEKGCIVGAEASKPGKAEEPEMNRNELMAALKAAGIKFSATAKKEEMAALLKAGPQKEEPKKPDAPEAKGTGDQDVL